MLPARTVLLTGATGFLGAHLLRSLLEHGAQTVVCLLRDPDRTRLDAVLTAYLAPTGSPPTGTGSSVSPAISPAPV